MSTDQHRYLVPFNRPLNVGGEASAVCKALDSDQLSGSAPHIRACEDWFLARTGSHAAHFMSSCTQALEMAALLAGLGPGDEVIIPSYTFVSTANAVVLRGATPVFVDVRPDTCNLDERALESAITSRTRAIVPVHYAGVACEMDAIMAVSREFGLVVIEDAAHGVMGRWRGRELGGIGHFGAYSFHQTKNYTSGGEGGMLLVNTPDGVSTSEIVRDMGTNRADFFRGNRRCYEWLAVGSSYHASEIQAAALSAQLACAEQVNERRIALWQRYQRELSAFCEHYGIRLPGVPEGCHHNAHIFYVRVPRPALRDEVLAYMNAAGVQAQSHYLPLHVAPAAARYAQTAGECVNAVEIAGTIIRLPLFYSLSDADQQRVIETFKSAVIACESRRGQQQSA